MPPKRKNDDRAHSQPKKRAKSEDDQQDERPVIKVNWAIPKEKTGSMYKEAHAVKYARALYQRAREEIDPQQTTLPDPQHRAPIYKVKTSKKLLATDQNRPSASLRSLFNDIKSKSTLTHDVRYNLAHLEEHFSEQDPNIAVVLSRAENNDILVLNRDERLEVTVNNTHAHINLVRRSPPGAKSPMGYFIELPPGTTVTVNGTTYINSDDLPSTPFYIGPLEGYAIIELLSQPVFFFRTRDSLRHLASSRVVTREELDRRDRNGNVAVEDTAVRWRPVAALPLGTESGNEGDLGEATSNGGSKSTQEPEGELYDPPTDESQLEEDPWRYVRAKLSVHRSNRYAELIPRVLASVNQRQPDGTGFSYQHQERIFRPGKTLLVPLNIDENYVLLIVHMQPDKRINLNVLDPMTWQTTPEIRTSIFEAARKLLSKNDWWQDMFDTSDDMIDSLPGDVEWVPTAQITTSDGSFIYTVLNAWALAMGLDLNPSFTPSLCGYESFFIQAQQLFDLALQDQLTWKLLFAFFRCSRFIKSINVCGAGEEAMSPGKSRQFDLRKRSFQDLINRQRAADTETERKKIDMDSITFGFESGKRHRQTFASDCLRKSERIGLDSIVREGRWKFTDTANELRKLLKERATVAASLLLPLNPYIDNDPVTDDFDPCLHLHTELQKLVKEEKIMTGVDSGLEETVLPALTPKEVNDSIEAVGQAINDLLPFGHGFTVCEHSGVIQSSAGKISGELDDVVLMLCHKGEEKKHFTLVVLQQESETDYRCAVARVLDSAPWNFTAEERKYLHELLQDSGQLKVETHPDTMKTGTNVGQVLTWMHGPQQFQTEQSGYFAIMNAWAVLLGLPINNDFCPGERLLEVTPSLIQAVENGEADWKLIWAFLLCVGYTKSKQPPPLERRFRTTRKPNPIKRGTIDGERRLRAAGARHDINYPHFPVNTGLAHTETFPWDDFNGADRSTQIPEMIKSGKYTKFLSPEIEFVIQGISHQDIISPCAQFHGRLNEILENQDTKIQLKDFRDSKDITCSFGEWLVDEEVSNAIAAVTFAITKLQQDYLCGFGSLTQTQVQLMAAGVPSPWRTPRPGRPLFAPIVIKNHFLLLVVQLNDENEPTFSVLDSKAYHLLPDERAEVHERAWNLMFHSKWMEKVFPESQWQSHKPTHTTWIPVSQQPGDNECGYYAIMNGWTLALGLTPDPNAHIEWTDTFYRDLQDVIHLARIGQADWSLIYGFLVCYGFILPGEVSADRCFSYTTKLVKEVDIDKEKQNIVDLEDFEFAQMGISMLDVSTLRHVNKVRLPPGRQHNGVGAFPSDVWSEKACKDHANHLARKGRLSLDLNETQLKEAYDKLRDIQGTALRHQLEKDNADYKKQPPEQLLKICQNHLNEWHKNKNLLVENQPCSFFDDTRDFYRYLFQEDFLGDVLRSEGSGTRDWDRPMKASEINLAIAAVVAAIDDLQLKRHKDANPDAPFAGGFCLSTSTDIARATVEQRTPVSRPRRCWFIPLSLCKGVHLDTINAWRKKNKKSILNTTTNVQGHHILVVLQESVQDEVSMETAFEMNIYDSAPHILADAIAAEDDPVFDIITDIADELKWAQQRLNGEESYFQHTIPVPRQLRGGWQSGPHVVINAWILALGLYPDHEKDYDNDIYREFYILARAAVVGLLDWQTLVAWIFGRKLATETELVNVTPDRRFYMTHVWENEASLRDRIREIEQDEMIVAPMSEADLPYNRSNDPRHERNPVSKKEKEKATKHELRRSYDDADLEFLGQPRHTSKKLGGESQARHGCGRRGNGATISRKKREARSTQLGCDM